MATVPFELDMTEYDSQEALDAGGNPAAGTYHAVVAGPPKTDVMDKDHALLDCMEIRFQIICGTTPGQERTSFAERFFYPKAQQKDGGSFCRRRLTKLALAAGLISYADLGRKVAIDWGQIEGQQVVLKVKDRKWTSEKNGTSGTAAELDGISLFHPLDPRVASVPKDIDLIREAELVWTGGDASSDDDGQEGGAALAPAQPAPVAATPPANPPVKKATNGAAKTAAANGNTAQAAPVSSAAPAAVAAVAAKPANDPFAGL